MAEKALAHRRKRQLAACDGFRKSGRVVHVLERLGVSVRSHYRWLKTDEWYARQFEKATQGVRDLVDGLMMDAAIEGLEERTVSQKWGESVTVSGLLAS